MQQIAKGWKDDPDTLPWLKINSQFNDNRAVAWVAVQQVGQGWKDDPNTLSWLKTQIQSDKDWSVRRSALEQLAFGWKDDPDTLIILKTYAQFDDNSPVRYTAMQELGDGWKDESWMFEFCYNCALNDPFERGAGWEDNPRKLALDLIMDQYPNHPETLPLIRDRAENDPDEKVREFANKKLAELEKEN